MTRALVTGATGFLGSYLVRRLLAGGVNVRVFVRPSSDIRYLQTLPVEITYGEIGQQELLLQSVTRCEWVFHVAGLVRPVDIFSRGNDFSQLRLVNVDFTESILEASRRADVGRFFYVSSTSVYGLDACPPIGEDTPLNPSSDYGLSKTLAEKWVKVYQANGLATTIIRPSIVYGPGDRYLAPLTFSLIHLPILPMIDGGGSFQDLVHVQDVAELIWLTSQSDITVNKTYNAASGVPLPLRDMLTAMRRFTGKPVRSFAISSKIILRWLSVFKWLMKRFAPDVEAILTPIGLAYLSQDVYYDISLAKRELNYAPQFIFPEGLQITS